MSIVEGCHQTKFTSQCIVYTNETERSEVKVVPTHCGWSRWEWTHSRPIIPKVGWDSSETAVPDARFGDNFDNIHVYQVHPYGQSPNLSWLTQNTHLCQSDEQFVYSKTSRVSKISSSELQQP